MRWLKILFPLFLPAFLLAQPNSGLDGTNVIINADKAVEICSGTGAISLAVGCTGGGTTYKHTFGTDGSLALPGTLTVTSAVVGSSSADLTVSLGTADASDTQSLKLCAGGSCAPGRGGYIVLQGEEVSSGEGGRSGGDIIYTASAGDGHNFVVDSTAVMTVTSTGLTMGASTEIQSGAGATDDLTLRATDDVLINAGDDTIFFYTPGGVPTEVLRIDEGNTKVNFTAEVSLGTAATSTGVLCTKADGNIGQCTSAVGAGGTCTCA